jgi:hypothetical protein
MYRAGRRNWKNGDWLVQDEESGVVRYASKITRDYLGRLITKGYEDYEHPQNFIKGLNDPKALPFVHPVHEASAICQQFDSIYIGNTSVTAQRDGPADHLFEQGIDEMEIGCSFIIYPEGT